MSFNVRVGDHGYQYTSTLGALVLEDEQGVATFSSITFRYRLKGGHAVKTGAAVVVDQGAGTVGYTFAEGDLDKPGTLQCLWEIVYIDGGKRFYPAPESGSFEEILVHGAF